MDSTPTIRLVALPQHRRQPTQAEAEAARNGGGQRRSGSGGDRRLRLVGRPDTRVARQANAIEAAFSANQSRLLGPLAELEAELGDAESASGRGALEQIAFIRVGLRCLADAIGELQAHLTDPSMSDSGDGGA